MNREVRDPYASWCACLPGQKRCTSASFLVEVIYSIEQSSFVAITPQPSPSVPLSNKKTLTILFSYLNIVIYFHYLTFKHFYHVKKNSKRLVILPSIRLYRPWSITCHWPTMLPQRRLITCVA